MTTLIDPNVGKIFVPELSAVTIGPSGRSKTPKHIGVVSYAVRHTDDEGKRLLNQAGYGVGLANYDGLAAKWHDSPELRELFPTVDLFLLAVRTGLTQRMYAHNERVQNGARMLAKGFWGASSSPQVSTVGVPSYVALNSASTFNSTNFSFAHNNADLSLGAGTSSTGAGVTTNEYTTAGLSRALGTVGSYTDPASALDGVFTLTVTKTFTCSSGPQNVYGTGLFDESSTATCNLFAEAYFATATLQTSDTLALTWNISA